MDSTVVIADAHPGFAEGIAHELRRQGFRVVACCSDGRAALAAIREHHPDIAVLDLRLLLADGGAVLREVVSARFQTDVLVCLTATQAVRLPLRELDACGYVSKESSVEEFGTFVRRAIGGGFCVSPELQGILRTPRRDLSPREVQVLKLVEDGMTDKAIGARLFISRETVRTILDRCSDKLGVRGRTALVATALRRGLLD